MFGTAVTPIRNEDFVRPDGNQQAADLVAYTGPGFRCKMFQGSVAGAEEMNGGRVDSNAAAGRPALAFPHNCRRFGRKGRVAKMRGAAVGDVHDVDGIALKALPQHEAAATKDTVILMRRDDEGYGMCGKNIVTTPQAQQTADETICCTPQNAIDPRNPGQSEGQKHNESMEGTHE